MDPVILIFGCVAAFFIFKLLSALGENPGEPDGQQRDGRNDFDALRTALSNGMKKVDQVVTADDEFDDSQGEVSEPQPVRAISAAGETLVGADPGFDEKAFLDGAKSAYEMIVEGFARGDISGVKQFLGDSVFNAFNSAIDQRQSANHVMDLKFVGIDSAKIVEAGVSDEQLTAVTDFASNQVRVTRDDQGNVIDGDPVRIDLVRDRWTFARQRDSRNPNWVLVATGVQA